MNGTDDLGADIGENLVRRKAPAAPQSDRDRGVEMTARDVADGVGHRQHRQAKSKRNASQADSDRHAFRGQKNRR